MPAPGILSVRLPRWSPPWVGLTALAVFLARIPGSAHGQPAHRQPAKQIAVETQAFRARILWQPTPLVDSGFVARLVAALRAQRPTAGIPARSFANGVVTITLASHLPETIDAWAEPEDRLISLSLIGVSQWKFQKLKEVIHHEMVHLELDTFLRGVHLTDWFREGIAEWLAAGLSCEGRVRMQLDILQRRTSGDQMPPLFSPGGFDHTRLAYDYLASFFDYLNARGGQMIADGRLLRAVKEYGIDDAVLKLGGKSRTALERAWWTELVQRMLADPIRCTT